MDLFFTQDPARGEEVASRLCDLNKQRQDIELEIHRQAKEMLDGQQAPEAIVLASSSWHQGLWALWPPAWQRNSAALPSSFAWRGGEGEGQLPFLWRLQLVCLP